MVNVHVIGRLGADAETLNGKNGKFIKFRIAVDDFTNGEKTTTWLKVLFSGERAERMAQYLNKGSMVSIHGTESVEIYTDKNGNPQVSRDINAYDVDFVRTGKGQGQEDATNATPQVTTGKLAEPKTKPTPTAAPTPTPTVTDTADDVDDLPF